MLVLTWECSLDFTRNLLVNSNQKKEKNEIQRSRTRSHLMISCMAFMSRPPLPVVSRQMLSMK
jgi:hypothetical protein